MPKSAILIYLYFSHWLNLSAPGDGRGSDRMEFAQAAREQVLIVQQGQIPHKLEL